MSIRWEADELVIARSENLDRYKRNFLQQAVCELRFPTLMELGDVKPPASVVSALRKEYPHLELSKEVTIGIGGESAGSTHSHVFRSSKLTWTVSLKQNALSIETTAYTTYAQLRERVLRAVAAVEKVIDSDFYTRVGLRYINVIDTGDQVVNGWINPALVEPLRSGAFKGIDEYAGKLQLTAADGGCLLQHGVRRRVPKENQSVVVHYLLDIDTYRSDVPIATVGVTMDCLHRQAFDMFDWSLGTQARDYLAKEKL